MDACPDKRNPVHRFFWVDFLKGMAILAVLVDHYNIFPEWVHAYSIYSVATFFIVAGFNAYFSIERNNTSTIKNRLRSLLPFLYTYMIANFVIYTSSILGHTFIISDFLYYIFSFSIQPPFYFCAIFIQLGLMTGYLYKSLCPEKGLLYKCKIYIGEKCYVIILLLIFFIVSLFLKNVITFPYLHGGGKNLFGSTYLFLIVTGMVCAKYYKKLDEFLRNHVKYVGIFLLLFIVSITQIHKAWSNPPNIYAISYSLSIFMLVLATSSALRACTHHTRTFSLIVSIVIFLGRYSIHIFMYHFLFIQLFSYFFVVPGFIFLSAVVASVIMGFAINNLLSILRRKFPAMFLDAHRVKIPPCIK